MSIYLENNYFNYVFPYLPTSKLTLNKNALLYDHILLSMNVHAYVSICVCTIKL